MAKVYSPPVGFEPPDFEDLCVDGRWDPERDRQVHDEYLARLTEFVKNSKRNTIATHKDGDLIGEIVHFPQGDGSAAYMVFNVKPLELLHLAIHDAWALPEAHERGLKLADIRDVVERNRAWKRRIDEVEAWWAAQPLGLILHYHNGFGQYVRCEVADGEWHSLDGKQEGRALQPIALIGNWAERDLEPTAYHAKKIVEGDGLWRANTGCIYEHPSFSPPKGDAASIDPTKLDPLPIKVRA
jgi:hypothetical protein